MEMGDRKRFTPGDRKRLDSAFALLFRRCLPDKILCHTRRRILLTSRHKEGMIDEFRVNRTCTFLVLR